MSEEWKTMAQRFAELQRQLAEVTAERDQYKAAYELQDLQRRTVKGDNHVH
jgi:hypothetical protein